MLYKNGELINNLRGLSCCGCAGLQRGSVPRSRHCLAAVTAQTPASSHLITSYLSNTNHPRPKNKSPAQLLNKSEVTFFRGLKLFILFYLLVFFVKLLL